MFAAQRCNDAFDKFTSLIVALFERISVEYT